jgi:hypothetical protein
MVAMSYVRATTSYVAMSYVSDIRHRYTMSYVLHVRTSVLYDVVRLTYDIVRRQESRWSPSAPPAALPSRCDSDGAATVTVLRPAGPRPARLSCQWRRASPDSDSDSESPHWIPRAATHSSFPSPRDHHHDARHDHHDPSH